MRTKSGRQPGRESDRKPTGKIYGKSVRESEQRGEWYLDARTKIFLMLTMNVVLLNNSSAPLMPYLRLMSGLLPCFLLLSVRRFKMALNFFGFYIVSYAIIRSGFLQIGGLSSILLGFLSSIGTRFLPGGMMGAYFFVSTRVNEFVASMERMHVPQKVIIPISVMFRFFPTVREEAAGISDAMRMRKLGFSRFFSRPTEILEYRMVPLMISVVNTGEDLSASALTRCLGMEKDRTNISRCGFGVADVLLGTVGMAALVLYVLSVSGVI